MEPTFLSLLPPLVAIVLALLTRHVLLSLLGGIVLGEFVLNQFVFSDTLYSFWDRLSRLLSEPWILKTLAFALLVGGVMALLRASGGVSGLVHWATQKQRLIASKRGALLFTYGVGIVIFVESSITALIAGAVGRPLCDRYGVSRAKLAYVCDTTSAPICSLIALNGWGALMLGLIVAHYGGDAGVPVLLESLLFNFYAMSALLVAFAVIWFDLDTPAMQVSEIKNEMADEETQDGNVSFLLLPIMVMLATVLGSLYVTGEGSILKGSGSSAILHSMIVTLIFMALLYRKRLSAKVYLNESWQGIKSMQSITLILFLAFMIGDVTKALQTGVYLASYAQSILNPHYLAAVVFVLSAVMAFATGTSWGTFGIMIPIAMSMGDAMSMEAPLLIGAAISGGVFGDHCSPISDTTIISSLSAGCDHIVHVKTQLPYALVSGAIALGMFLLFGFL